MTTVTINSNSARRNTPMQLTARGRRVVGFLISLPLFAGLIALSIAFADQAGASVENPFASSSLEFEYVTIGHGETLWQLAAEIAPSADPRDVVAELKQFNALSSSAVQPGQRLAIPSKYTP
ncbi:MAG: LysM peptidoglycan-binding domain-containing protein [Microbacteriaceae bacterium]